MEELKIEKTAEEGVVKVINPSHPKGYVLHGGFTESDILELIKIRVSRLLDNPNLSEKERDEIKEMYAPALGESMDFLNL